MKRGALEASICMVSPVKGFLPSRASLLFPPPGALLLEDGLVAPQTGGSEDYVHDNILRKILSADIFGEDLGSLESGAAAGRDFPVDDLADGGNYHVLVYVTDGGKVNSVADITLP